MEFGIAVATAADSWKLVERAEALGFDAAWFYDTQMLSADCFVAMGRCGKDLENTFGHGRFGAIESDRGRHCERARLVKSARPRTHRLRRGNRLYRQTRNGARRDETR